MKLVWCPETAAKAYIEAVELLSSSSSSSDVTSHVDVSELVAAMAGGWQAQCIVEAPWINGGLGSATSSQYPTSAFSTSLALAAAARRTGGRHVCVVSDDQAREEYLRGLRLAAGPAAAKAVEVATGEAGTLVAGIQGVDFAVVDCRRGDASKVLRALQPGHRGAVVVCKEAAMIARSNFGGNEWKGVFMPGARVVRAAKLPLGDKGVDVVHVGVGKGPTLWDEEQKSPGGRWLKHVDRITGEEHLFRR